MSDRRIRLYAVLASLVLANLLGLTLYTRLDWTRDKEFTLSPATRSTLETLKDPITVRAYFTQDLPPPYSSNARFVRDLLEEYHAAADGQLSFEFLDPLEEETGEDKEKKKETQVDLFGRTVREATRVEQELQSLGIPAVQVRSNESDKMEVKRAYMGLSVRYREKQESIPVVRETAGLEYDLTSLIRKMVRAEPPRLGLVTGFGGPDPAKDMQRVRVLLDQIYDVSEIDLSAVPTIADEIDGLLVVGPERPVSEEAKQAIDRFVTSGKPAAFLVDAAKIDLQTLQATPVEHGLSPLLEAYGARIDEGLVADAECATLNVSQRRGNMIITQPVRYPLLPFPKGLDPDHPVTRGIGGVSFPFTSPLAVKPATGVDAETIVRSSTNAGVIKAPYDIDPMQRWTVDRVSDTGEKALVVALKGAIPSAFGGSAAVSGRVFVAGGSSFLQDRYLSRGNEALVLNLVDWMLLDDALLSIRTRGLRAAPLAELSDAKRRAVKYANIAGLPAAFVGFGLLRWRVREKRRGQARSRIEA